MFEPMAIVLVQTFHVLLLHMPGHGESERMEDGWQPLDMAQRIFSTIRQLGFIGCYAFGHSLGAAMALLIEADINPGTFAAIFAYEPPLLTPQDRLDVIAAYSKGTAGPRLDEMARRRKKRFDSRESARERLGKKMSTFDPRVFDLYLKHGLKPVAEVGVEVELACNPIIEEDIYLVMDPPPTSHNLRYISCPVTIAVGDMSEGPHARLINGSVSIHKSLRASRSKLIRFKGISHFGPFERPEVVAEAIKEAFLIRSRI